MKIEFTITTARETRTYIREYEPSTPEYVISDDAYADAVNYINTHNMETLEGVDINYRPLDKNVQLSDSAQPQENSFLTPELW